MEAVGQHLLKACSFKS